jgi:tRNA modification GTPase
VRDTIFALSSGALPAGIAIIRISGADAFAAAERLGGTLPPARTLALRTLRDPGGEELDRALVAIFAAPHTVTGEQMAELHCHGGRAVVARLLEVLGSFPGLREAEPGEFTRRALENDRLDLTEAEGLADLLAAETEWQRRAAIGVVGGGLRRQIEAWRERLVLMAAEAEAAIDYVDEEETELELGELVANARALGDEWRKALEAPRTERIQAGLRVVLAGPPNAGKSSLFNALIGDERAIVTPIPGTTRDLVEAQVDLGGVRMTFVDTAGIRESDDPVEQIGVTRSYDAMAAADLLLWLGPVDERPDHVTSILVHARADERGSEVVPEGAVTTSVTDGIGVDELRHLVLAEARKLLPAPDSLAFNRRQAAALGDAAQAIALVQPQDSLLTAEALRQALHALDRLSGRQGTEDVLDALFGRFCLGK